MVPSVIILTKNKADTIADCIRSAQTISDDVVVVDSGSTDDTLAIAAGTGARTLSVEWESYGAARNAGAAIARYDWVMSLDADERISQQLKQSIIKLAEDNTMAIYGFRRENFMAKKRIRFGEWGQNSVYRLYFRHSTSWDLLPVHESLFSDQLRRKLIKGSLIHYTISTMDEFEEKSIYYASLNAQKYFAQGRKASFIKRFLSPAFNFMQFYILRLGFLDGREGFFIARTKAYYTWLKYQYLHRLNTRHSTTNRAEVSKGFLLHRQDVVISD